MSQRKYNYFYRIENKIDGKFYYGIHSTDNLNDGYMGSGRRLREAMRIFGKNNFTKEILKFFDSRGQASDYEARMVTEELVLDDNCYNVRCGGDYGLCIGGILVKDKDGNFFKVFRNNEQYKSGELTTSTYGLVPVFDKTDETYKLIDVETFKTKRENFITYSDGKVVVKDEDNNISRVSIDDERYINGTLLPIWCGKKHTEESKKKMSETHKQNHHQQGTKNSQYGTCWVTKNGDNKKISQKEIDTYIKNGWTKGRFVSKDEIVYPTDSISVEKVTELYSTYKSWRKVAKELGIGRQTLLNYRKRNMQSNSR